MGAADFIAQNAAAAEYAQQQYGVPADVLLGIAGSESNWGNAPTYFGIIDTPDWTGTHQQFVSGGSDCPGCTVDLRTYPSFAAGIQDFIALVSGAGRYQQAWAQRGNADAFLHGLQSAGYGPPDWPGNVESDIAVVDQQLQAGGAPLPDSQGFSAPNVTLDGNPITGAAGAAAGAVGGVAGAAAGALGLNKLGDFFNPLNWVKALTAPFESIGIFVLGAAIIVGGIVLLSSHSETVKLAAKSAAEAG